VGKVDPGGGEWVDTAVRSPRHRAGRQSCMPTTPCSGRPNVGWSGGSGLRDQHVVGRCDSPIAAYGNGYAEKAPDTVVLYGLVPGTLVSSWNG
jgi:hypothetical protein